ncbi:glycerophosphodiester phosphodiesterase [Candidatus Peregrinibacteria bacterium]|nr:glycerophosphodiester phosphodiesterase [Candidatus Peregrinibacteria bacterium]
MTIEKKETPKARPSAKEIGKTKIHHVIADELIGLQKQMNKIPLALKEMLPKNLVKSFFDRIFGKDSKAGTFLSMLTSALAEKFSLSGQTQMPWDVFKSQLAAAAKDVAKHPFNLREYIVSHRALGYGRKKENSAEAIVAAIKGGEKQIEIDLRLGIDGEIYLNHDPIGHIKNPEKHFVKLKDALMIFADNIHQDIVIFFDLKEQGIVEKMDEIIKKVDQKFSKKNAYVQIMDRHFILGFDFEILKKARKLKQNRPLIFCYIPLDRLKGLARLIEKLGQNKMIEICQVLDSFSGGNLSLDLAKTCVSVDDKAISETNETGENVLGIFTNLPSDEILKTVDYLCIPAVLAGAKLVKRIHDKGLNVAVWGASGKHIQEAIVESGADLVISDNPAV